MAIAKQVNNKEGKKDIFARSSNPGVPSRIARFSIAAD